MLKGLNQKVYDRIPPSSQGAHGHEGRRCKGEG